MRRRSARACRECWPERLLSVALNSRLPNQITNPAGSGSETPIGYGLDLRAIPGDQMGKREKNVTQLPLPGAPDVGVPTRGPGSQLVNAACFLVPDDDARGNHSNAQFYPGSGRGAVRPAKGVCEGTVLSCTQSACSRGYKRGERGREAPRSLLEAGLNVANRDAGAWVMMDLV